MGSNTSFGKNRSEGKPKPGTAAWFHWAAVTFRQWQAEEEAAWHQFLTGLPDLARACSRLTLGLGGLAPQGSEGIFKVGVSVLTKLARCSRSVMYRSLREFDSGIDQTTDDPDAALYPWKPGSWINGKQAQWRVRRIMPLDKEVALFYLDALVEAKKVKPTQIEQVKPIQIEQVTCPTCSNRDIKGPPVFPQKTSSSSETTPPTKPVVVDGVVGRNDVQGASQEVEPLLTEGMQRLVTRLGNLREELRLNPAGARLAVSTLAQEEVDCLLPVGDEFWEDQAKQILARPIRTTVKSVLYSRISKPSLRQDLLIQAKQWVSNRKKAVLSGGVAPEGMTLREAVARLNAEEANASAEGSTGYSSTINAVDEAWSALLSALKARHPLEYQTVESEAFLVLRATTMREGSPAWKRGVNHQLKTRISERLPKLLEGVP